jgi:hypothetical protein
MVKVPGALLAPAGTLLDLDLADDAEDLACKEPSVYKASHVAVLVFERRLTDMRSVSSSPPRVPEEESEVEVNGVLTEEREG